MQPRIFLGIYCSVTAIFFFSLGGCFSDSTSTNDNESVIISDANSTDAVENVVEIIEPTRKKKHLLDSDVLVYKDSNNSEIFQIRNKSKKEQILTLTGKNCSCVSVLFDGQVIQNGESFSLPKQKTVSLILERAIRLDSATSSKAQLYHSLSDRKYELNIEQPLLATLRAEPATLRFKFSENIIQPLQVKLRFHRNQIMDEKEAISIKVPPEIHIDSFIKTGSPIHLTDDIYEQSYNIQFSRDNSLQLKTDIQNYILISSNCSQGTAQKYIPVYLEGLGGISIPSNISLGFIKKGESGSKKFRVISEDGAKFRVQSVKSNLRDLSINVQNKASQDSHWIEVNIVGNNDGFHKGKLTINTDHPTQNEISSDISFFVGKQ